MSEASSRSFPGAIGRYQILELVGGGSMGNVYKAFDPQLNRLVAIKTVRRDLLLDDASSTPFRVRFYREAQILGSLSHPHIVSLYDMGESDGSPYMVMEYGSPRSLARQLSFHRCIGLERTLTLLQPLAEAIDYAHGASVVHLDLKPSNILLDDACDCPKITDFGVAKILGSGMDSSLGLFGTPGYMSPEQVRSEAPSHRSDLFSLAVVAFEMLSGERPFPGGSVEAVLYRIVHAEPALPSSLPALGWAEADWGRIFSKALAKDPGERFTSAAELVDELGSLEPSGAALSIGLHRLDAARSPWIEAPPTVALPAPPRYAGLSRRLLVAALCGAGASVVSLALLGSSPVPAGPTRPLEEQISSGGPPSSKATETATATTGRQGGDVVATVLEERDAAARSLQARSTSRDEGSHPPAGLGAPAVPRVALRASVRLRNGVLVVENLDSFDWTDVELTLGAPSAVLELGKFKAGRLYSLPLSASTSTASTASAALARDDLPRQDVTIVCRTPTGEGWYSVRAVASR